MDDYYAKISKSKYSLSGAPDVAQVKADLEGGAPVLFIGCPCQVKELKKALGGDYDNLLTVDLLCNGCSRPELLAEFVAAQEEEAGSKVAALDMRPGHGMDIYIRFADGQEKTIKDTVTRVFVCNKKNYVGQCLMCRMHAAGNGAADLTIGDFWQHRQYKDVCGPAFSPYAGTNIAYVNTEKGRTAFNQAKPFVEWRYLR